MKLCIDTNYFLDFYRNGKERLNVLEEIKKYAEHIVFPVQVYNEFKRNMSSVKEVEIKKFKESNSSLNHSSSKLVRELPEFEEYNNAKTKLLELSKALGTKLDSILTDWDQDAVFLAFDSLYKMEKVKRLETTEDNIKRAKIRNLLGEPPGTNTRTIGDEVIWEVLLQNVCDDLILVTNDESFKKNEKLLAIEYEEKSNKNLFIVDKLSNAIKLLGSQPAESIINYELEVTLSMDPYFDLLMELYEVRDFASLLNSSNSSLIMYIERTEVHDGLEYKVLYVGESKETHKVRWNTFYVNLERKRILVYDLLKDSVIPLQKWRNKSSETTGHFAFDFNDNNGVYVIGFDEYLFETQWSEADNNSIHAYSYCQSIKAIGYTDSLIEFPKIEDINDLTFNFSSISRRVKVGQLVVWENNWGNFAVTKIKNIEVRSRGSVENKLELEYKIYL